MAKIDDAILALQKQLDEWGVKYDRQHGKIGKVLDDPEAEKKRIRACLASQVSRYKSRMFNKELNNKISSTTEDDFGITDKDERRFKACFCFENIAPELTYVQRMTGLTYEQIKILEQKFNLKIAAKAM